MNDVIHIICHRPPTRATEFKAFHAEFCIVYIELAELRVNISVEYGINGMD